MTTFLTYRNEHQPRVSGQKRYCDWVHSAWFLLLLGCMVFMATLTGLLSEAPAAYIFGQIFLGVSVYVSLLLLANRPLINPIQAVVAVFYWWFGVGPAVIATWNYLKGWSNEALATQVSGMEALWIVALGLPLYALSAKLTLAWFSRKGLWARFLSPPGETYRPKVLIIYLCLMGFSTLALTVLEILGIHGLEETSFFGGTTTTIWWVGVIAALGSIAPFLSSTVMTSLASPWTKIPSIVKLLIVVVIAQTVFFALLGGWKSPIAILAAYYVCAYVSRNQRPPWMLVVAGSLIFLLVITPFVTYGRHSALVSGAGDSAMREKIFAAVLEDPAAFLPSAMDSVDPSVFFRGLAPLAGELTRRSELLDGEWQGYTFAWGFEILIPRVLMPTKRDASIGNFFSQTVGADIGVTNRNDTINNIAISIPFEFVGNFGWFAGFLSFGLIGVFWTLLCSWVLSPQRLSSHPLAPMFSVSVMAMEGALGHYLAALRGLIIPFLLCYVVFKLLRGRI